MAVTLEQLPVKVNIKLYRGDDLILRMRWWADESKTTLRDLSGASAILRIKDPDTGAGIDTLESSAGDIELLDGSGDYNLVIKFLKSRTDGYTWELGNYDFEFTDSAGFTRTPFNGVISVVQDVRY
jgi:hypothetical protein